MTFLPIVDRELRVAARKTVTHWTRVGAALLAALITAGVLIIAGLQQGMWLSQLGSILFSILKWLGFVAVSLAGVFLTSDCLSEEKRQGTLGLLFLTDLRGYDVVLGKLLATSLRAVYGVLAVFPIMGLVFLVGGVTGSEFWRLMLVWCNTLFFSLALGVGISSLSRDSQKAMSATLLAGLGFLLLPWVVDWAIAGGDQSLFVPRFSLVSSLCSFLQAGNDRSAEFWPSLGLIHIIGWSFLALACRVAPRNWQEKAVGSRFRFRRRQSPTTAPSKRALRRRKLLDRNPVLWLAGRDRWLAWGLRAVMYGAAAVIFLTVWESKGGLGLMQISSGVILLAGVIFTLWFASQSSRFLVDARHNGMMELLLATPLTPRQIVRGHWRMLLDLFLMPGLLFLALQVFVSIVAVVGTSGVSSSMPNQPDYQMMQLVSLVAGVAKFVVGLLAVGWFGIWMGLTSKSPSVALLKTIAFVKVLPWFALSFSQGIFFFMVAFGKWGIWIAPLIAGALALAVDIVFVVIARKRALTHFRFYVWRAEGRKR